MLFESLRTLRASPATSALLTLIAAAATSVILLATAETLQAERTILGSLEAPELRLIILRDIDGSAGLPVQAADRIQAASSVEWAVGLGDAEDVAVFEGGPAVPLRALFGTAPPPLRLPRTYYEGNVALGDRAVVKAGLIDGLGTVSSRTRTYSAGGRFDVEEPLGFLASSGARQPEQGEQPSQIAILTEEVAALDATARFAVNAAGAASPTRLSISMPDDIETLRSAIAGEIGNSGRSLTLLVLTGAGGLLALVTSVGVVLKRADLGRRRALGATRGYIIQLVLSQAAVTSLTGAVVGAAASHLYRWSSSQLAPSLEFSIAAVVLVTAASMMAGLIPAIGASLSDPVKVLRIP